MNRTFRILFVCMFWLVCITVYNFVSQNIAFAQPPPPATEDVDEDDMDDPKDGKFRERIETLRKLKLMEALDMTEEQSLKFFPKFDALEKARIEHFKRQRQLLKDLKNELKLDKPSDENLKKKLDEIEKNKADFEVKEKQLRKEMLSTLTVKQQAQLVLFQVKFERQLRRIIEETRLGKGKHPELPETPKPHPKEFRNK